MLMVDEKKINNDYMVAETIISQILTFPVIKSSYRKQCLRIYYKLSKYKQFLY